MPNQFKVLFVFGTRPEAIKMAPLIEEIKKSLVISASICVTGQHQEMLHQVLHFFDISPDYDLKIMSQNQDLFDVTSRVLLGLREVLSEVRYDAVLVHGDTSTAFAASLAAFYAKAPVIHIEAGLRTGNLNSPWPEELNRRLVSKVAQLHFCPTEDSMRNLLVEGIPEADTFVTGNTVIDALLRAVEKIEGDQSILRNLEERFSYLDFKKKVILVTGHRRENIGGGLTNICEAIRDLSTREDIEIVYPVHRNPAVIGTANSLLSGISNVHLISPQDYAAFVFLMSRATVILTDSGGIQEEAPALGKPVLVLRDTTERPEAVREGTVKLVGSNRAAIVESVCTLLDSPAAYQKMAQSKNPYGDGRAAKRIIAHMERRFLEIG